MRGLALYIALWHAPLSRRETIRRRRDVLVSDAPDPWRSTLKGGSPGGASCRIWFTSSTNSPKSSRGKTCASPTYDEERELGACARSSKGAAGKWKEQQEKQSAEQEASSGGEAQARTSLMRS